MPLSLHKLVPWPMGLSLCKRSLLINFVHSHPIPKRKAFLAQPLVTVHVILEPVYIHLSTPSPPAPPGLYILKKGDWTDMDVKPNDEYYYVVKGTSTANSC